MFRVSLIIFAVLLLLLTLLSAYGGSLQAVRTPETFLQELQLPSNLSAQPQQQEEDSTEYFMTSSGGVPASQLPQISQPLADNESERQSLENSGFMVEPFEEEVYTVPAQF